MDINTISLAVSIVGIIVAVGTTVWSTVQLRRSVSVAFRLDVRKTINRIERNKERFKQKDAEAYNELFDVQGELEVIDAKLREIFALKK